MTKIKRNMIKIDEEKCTGCSLCIPGCPEGALAIVDTPEGPKARVVKENFCDGLGACVGNCPEDALSVIEEEVEEYDEIGVMENIVKQGDEKIIEHLDHLKDHDEIDNLKKAVHFLKDNKYDIDFSPYTTYVKSKLTSSHGGCPGSMEIDMRENKEVPADVAEPSDEKSRLQNWPVQIKLVSPNAPYLKGAEILVAADCVPFAYAGFHSDFIKDKIVMIGCPKLDDLDFYIDKLASIFEINEPKSVTVAHMEVPCCYGIVSGVQEAIKRSGKNVPFCAVEISIKGDKK